MKNALTQEQFDFYPENGYIVIEDFLSPDELETWRRSPSRSAMSTWVSCERGGRG